METAAMCENLNHLCSSFLSEGLKSTIDLLDLLISSDLQVRMMFLLVQPSHPARNRWPLRWFLDCGTSYFYQKICLHCRPVVVVVVKALSLLGNHNALTHFSRYQAC